MKKNIEDFDLIATITGDRINRNGSASFKDMVSSYDNLENCLTKLVSFLKKSDNDLQMANARDSKQSILQLAYNNYVHAWNGDIKANEIKSSYKSLDDIRRERLQMSADGVHGEI